MSLSPDSVIGVLVTYQPNESVAGRIQAHLKQLSHLVVVHNATDEPRADLKQPNVTLLSLSENNLARAQNLGISEAIRQSAEAVLLLDDDSDMGEEMLRHLCDAADAHTGLVAPCLKERNGQVSSRYVVPFLGVGFRSLSLEQQHKIDGAYNLIASGSLIPIEALHQVGLMDESFGIDYVDREFCLRLLTRGWKTRAISKATLSHRLGNSRQEALGVTTRNHSPARRYSIFRNRARCWARYGLTVPSFLIYDLMAAGYDLFRIVVFESDKAAKLRAAFCGLYAAIAGEKDA